MNDQTWKLVSIFPDTWWGWVLDMIIRSIMIALILITFDYFRDKRRMRKAIEKANQLQHPSTFERTDDW